jgi:pyridoxamine 5'-phosphate oxidase-like protein
LTTQPPVETLTELKLTDEIKRTVNEAYVPNDRPILMATIDADGRPNVTWRGSVIAYSDTQIGVWARNPEGGTATTLAQHPDVMLVYRESGGPGQRSRVTLNFRGKARVDDSEKARRGVYDNMPQRERDSDPEMKGVAIIVDLESVTGMMPGVRIAMQK